MINMRRGWLRLASKEKPVADIILNPKIGTGLPYMFRIVMSGLYQKISRSSKALLPDYGCLLFVPKLIFLVTVERARRSKS